MCTKQDDYQQTVLRGDKTSFASEMYRVALVSVTPPEQVDGIYTLTMLLKSL